VASRRVGNGRVCPIRILAILTHIKDGTAPRITWSAVQRRRVALGRTVNQAGQEGLIRPGVLRAAPGRVRVARR
jgi:hypothetical protein